MNKPFGFEEIPSTGFDEELDKLLQKRGVTPDDVDKYLNALENEADRLTTFEVGSSEDHQKATQG